MGRRLNARRQRVLTRGAGCTDWRSAPGACVRASRLEDDQAREGLAAWTVKARVQLIVRIESRLMPRVALEASTDDLAEFIAELHMSAGTRYTYIANLRAFYGWAKRQGHIAADPSTGLRYVLRQQRPTQEVIA